MTEELNSEFINRHLAAIKQKIAQSKESYDQDQLKQVPAEEKDIYDAVLRYRKEHAVKLNYMIKQHELRIGNLFNDEDGTPCYVAEIFTRNDGKYISDSGNNIYKESQVYPIPLTPEVLEKCSSGRDREKWVISYDFWIYDPLELDGVGSYSQRDTKIFAPMWKVQLLGFGIKYLHQLQNLYFALTGEELIYTP